MPDRKIPSGLRPESDHPLDEQLWDALDSVPERAPSEQLRRGFYQRLAEAARPPWWQGWFDALRHPMVGAFATLLIGLAIGTQLGRTDAPESDLSALRAEVAALNTTVALTLMDKGSTGERLQGVEVAAALGPGDPRLTQALLQVAAGDRSNSVRSAAIDALGPHLGSHPGLSAEIDRLIADTQSPLVQLALAELVMRYGADDQLHRLIEAAEAGQLLPEVNGFVLERTQRNQA